MKAIIFDLDGTLVSVNAEYRHKIIGKSLQELGKIVSKEQMDMFWFMHNRNEVIRTWDVKPQDFWLHFRKFDSLDHRRATSFAYDDVSCLPKLKKKGVKLALLTGSPSHIMEMSLEFLDRNWFDVVVSAHEFNGINVKPHPEGAYECLKKLGISAEDAIYVGNADEDILTAQNAGIYSVLIDRKEHKNALKADMRIESLYELEKMI